MVGWLGPYKSASNTPTRAPIFASAVAKLAVVVDLPTPPLPDATAMMFFTPLIVGMPFCTLCATTLCVISSFTGLPVAAAMASWICWAMCATG